MDKKEIKEAMSVIRPAIWALFGRRSVEIVGYSQLKVDLISGFLGKGHFEIIDINNEDKGYFKVKMVDWLITDLEWVSEP
jgi:hypothetical protein